MKDMLIGSLLAWSVLIGPMLVTSSTLRALMLAERYVVAIEKAVSRMEELK